MLLAVLTSNLIANFVRRFIVWLAIATGLHMYVIHTVAA